MTTTLAKTELPATAAASRLGRLGAPNVQIAYRIAGIEVRKAFTDSLKAFCEYVDKEGNKSSGGKGIYIQLSRRINVVFGLSRELAEEFLQGRQASLRNSCSIIELLTLQMLEIDLRELVDFGMNQKLSRHDIKQSLYACIDGYGQRYADRFARWKETA